MSEKSSSAQVHPSVKTNGNHNKKQKEVKQKRTEWLMDAKMAAQLVGSNENLSNSASEVQKETSTKLNPFEPCSPDPKQMNRIDPVTNEGIERQTLTRPTSTETSNTDTRSANKLKTAGFKGKLKKHFLKKKSQNSELQHINVSTNIATTTSEGKTATKHSHDLEKDPLKKVLPKREKERKYPEASVDFDDQKATTSRALDPAVRDSEVTAVRPKKKSMKHKFKKKFGRKKRNKTDREEHMMPGVSIGAAAKPIPPSLEIEGDNDGDYDVNPFLRDIEDVAETDEENNTGDTPEEEGTSMLPTEKTATNADDVDTSHKKGEGEKDSRKKHRKMAWGIFGKRKKSEITPEEPVLQVQPKADIDTLTKEVEETKQILAENVVSQLNERKEKLDDLVTKAKELEDRAEVFNTNARRIKQKYKCCCCYCPECWYRLIRYLRKKKQECCPCLSKNNNREVGRHRNERSQDRVTEAC